MARSEVEFEITGDKSNKRKLIEGMEILISPNLKSKDIEELNFNGFSFDNVNMSWVQDISKDGNCVIGFHDCSLKNTVFDFDKNKPTPVIIAANNTIVEEMEFGLDTEELLRSSYEKHAQNNLGETRTGTGALTESLSNKEFHETSQNFLSFSKHTNRGYNKYNQKELLIYEEQSVLEDASIKPYFYAGIAPNFGVTSYQQPGDPTIYSERNPSPTINVEGELAGPKGNSALYFSVNFSRTGEKTPSQPNSSRVGSEEQRFEAGIKKSFGPLILSGGAELNHMIMSSDETKTGWENQLSGSLGAEMRFNPNKGPVTFNPYLNFYSPISRNFGEEYRIKGLGQAEVGSGISLKILESKRVGGQVLLELNGGVKLNATSYENINNSDIFKTSAPATGFVEMGVKLVLGK